MLKINRGYFDKTAFSQCVALFPVSQTGIIVNVKIIGFVSLTKTKSVIASLMSFLERLS